MKGNLENIEQFVKNQLDSHKFAYDGSEWTKLQKNLPKQGIQQFFNPTFYFIASVVIVGVISTVLLVNNVSDDEPTTKSPDEISDNNITPKDVFIIPTDEEVVKENPIHSDNDEDRKENEVEETDEVETISSDNQNEQEDNVTEEQDNSVCEKDNEQLNNSTKNKIPCALFRVDITEGCTPFKVSFTPHERCDTIIYMWDFGDGSISTEMSPDHTYNEPGVYDLSLTVKYYKSEKVVTKTLIEEIVVNKTPEVDFIFDEEDGAYQFTTLSDLSLRYTWYFGDGQTSNKTNPEHRYFNNGLYSVKLKAVSTNGCENTAETQINVEMEPSYIMPDAFSPNGDGRNDYYGPVVTKTDIVEFEMQLFNKLGQMVYQTKSMDKPWDGRVMGNNKMCDTGVYVWIVKTKDKYGNSVTNQGHFSLIK